MLAPSLVIALLATRSGAQDAASSQHAGPDVVVEGRRDERQLQGGEWVLKLTPSYLYGRIPEFGSGESVVVGQDRSWKFCLGDTDIEPLARLLIGEGQVETVSTATCSPLNIRLGNGKLSADQICSGTSMQREIQGVGARSAPAGATTGDSGAGSMATGTGTTSTTVAAQDTLRIVGSYDSRKLRIDFDNRTTTVGYDPVQMARPEGRRWSIRGERVGKCRSPATAPAAGDGDR